jgi:hypothetical protein
VLKGASRVQIPLPPPRRKPASRGLSTVKRGGYDAASGEVAEWLKAAPC